MHYTPKKTTQLIIEGGNDYIITVKGNQPRLLAQLETLAQQQKPKERFVDVEKKRGRITCRIVNLFTDTSGIDFDWIPLLSNWVETLIFRWLKQRKFVKFSKSDRRGLSSNPRLRSCQNYFKAIFQIN